MRVTLIRHAEAGDDAPRDEARALTARGRADARRLGRALAPAGRSLLVDRHEPARARGADGGDRRRRDRTTAAACIATDLLRARGRRRGRGPVPAKLADEDEKSVALVAHEPILSARCGGADRQSPATRRCARRRHCASGCPTGPRLAPLARRREHRQTRTSALAALARSASAAIFEMRSSARGRVHGRLERPSVPDKMNEAL